jgi:glycosyltransferase involved in cell wall biosynthesis
VMGLRRTLDSVLQQGDASLSARLVVIDGGSTDGGVEVAREMVRDCDIVVSEPDGGVYDAMNKGIRFCESPYVLFLNSGDWLAEPDSLSHVLEMCDTRPVWAIVGARHHFGGTRESVTIPSIPHVWWKHAMGIQPHCHQATIFNLEALRVLGGYSLEAEFAADYELIVRFGMLKSPIQNPTVCVEYAGGGMSAARGKEIPMLQHRLRVKMFELSNIPEISDRIWVNYALSRAALVRLRDRIYRPDSNV